MQHTPSGTCEECKREMYTFIFQNDDRRSLGTVVLYHLGERCDVLPSYDDLLETT